MAHAVPKRRFEKFKKMCVPKRRLPILSTGLKAQRKPKNEILQFTLELIPVEQEHKGCTQAFESGL